LTQKDDPVVLGSAELLTIQQREVSDDRSEMTIKEMITKERYQRHTKE
jgi:hypothetical protein